MHVKKKFAIAGLVLLAMFFASLILSPISDSQMYSIALKAKVSKDDTFSGELNPQKVYVSQSLLDYLEFLMGNELDKSKRIPEEIQQEISKEAMLAGIEISWVEAPDSLTYNDLGEVEGGDAVVIFEEISRSFLVSELEAVIHVAYMASGSTIYKFYRTPFGWRLWSSRMGWIT